MRFTRALDLSSCWLHLSFAPGMNILVSYHISLSCGPAGQLELLHLCVEAFNVKRVLEDSLVPLLTLFSAGFS